MRNLSLSILITLIGSIASADYLEYATLDKDKYFSKGYCEARERFKQAAKDLGVSVSSEKVVYAKDKAGLDKKLIRPCKDESLTIDYFHMKAKNPENLLIWISGTHGVEAPAGSATQLMLMKEYLPKWTDDRTSVLMIHAMNPFGYKYMRRFNGNNVDLNRAYFTTEQAGAFYGKVSGEYNLPYEEIRHITENKELVSIKTLAFLPRQLLPFLNKLAKLDTHLNTVKDENNNKSSLDQAFAAGQYRNPKGTYFGGAKHQQEVQILEKVLKKTLSGYKKIIAFDLHTGVGAGEVLHILPTGSLFDQNEKSRFTSLFEYENEEEAKSMYRYDLGSESIGYTTHGDCNEIVFEMAKRISPTALVLPATAEWGTHELPPNAATRWALKQIFGDVPGDRISKAATLFWQVKENQGFHSGYESLEDRKITKKMHTHRFTPYKNPPFKGITKSALGFGTDGKVWQNKVIEQGRYLMDKVILPKMNN